VKLIQEDGNKFADLNAKTLLIFTLQNQIFILFP